MKKLPIIFSFVMVAFFVSYVISDAAFISTIRPQNYGLMEGDLISASDYGDPDIYIINGYGYKRLILKPQVFDYYGHLGFANTKQVPPEIRDSFETSSLVRNCEIGDPAVYSLEAVGEDEGVLHWINMTGDQAITEDPDFFKKIFCINNNEFNLYSVGSEYTSLSQIPSYIRGTTVAPVVTGNQYILTKYAKNITSGDDSFHANAVNANSGDTIIFSIWARGQGGVIENLKITEFLPEELPYIPGSLTISGNSQASGDLFNTDQGLTVGNLNVGGKIAIVFRVIVDGVGSLSNVVRSVASNLTQQKSVIMTVNTGPIDSPTPTPEGFARAELTDPVPGTTINAATVTFKWTSGANVEEYSLGVGTTLESVSAAPWGDIFDGNTAATSQEVTGIPLGQEIHVRVWSKEIDGAWFSKFYTFETVAGVDPTPTPSPTPTPQFEWMQTGTGDFPEFIIQNKACRVNLGEVAIFIPQVITCNEYTVGKHVAADVGFGYVYTSQMSNYWSGYAAAILSDKSLIRLTSYNSNLVCTGVLIPDGVTAGTKYTCQDVAGVITNPLPSATPIATPITDPNDPGAGGGHVTCGSDYGGSIEPRCPSYLRECINPGTVESYCDYGCTSNSQCSGSDICESNVCVEAGTEETTTPICVPASGPPLNRCIDAYNSASCGETVRARETTCNTLVACGPQYPQYTEGRCCTPPSIAACFEASRNTYCGEGPVMADDSCGDLQTCASPEAQKYRDPSHSVCLAAGAEVCSGTLEVYGMTNCGYTVRCQGYVGRKDCSFTCDKYDGDACSQERECCEGSCTGGVCEIDL